MFFSFIEFYGKEIAIVLFVIALVTSIASIIATIIFFPYWADHDATSCSCLFCTLHTMFCHF